MKEQIFYKAGVSDALAYAVTALKEKGCVFLPDYSPEVTHILLDTPHKAWDLLPKTLHENVTVVGGNLCVPALVGRKAIDLLQDPLYLAENANITAHCAVALTLQKVPFILDNCPVLILGWGRIGKCLARLLRNMGAQVTVAARKATDRAMLVALGYDAVDIQNLDSSLSQYRLIYNTIPAMVLSAAAVAYCSADCLKFELASLPGMAGEDIIDARGLPSRGAPESSGQLIARSILRLC